MPPKEKSPSAPDASIPPSDSAATAGAAQPPHPHAGAAAPPQSQPAEQPPLGELLHQVLTVLKARTGQDYSSYKTNTVLRRIERRMLANEAADLPSYLALLQSDPQEAQALCQDLLISVTGFFRDPEAFERLRQEIIPRLFAGRDPDDPVRIWHACCATGEEVYSMAMLIREHLDRNQLHAKVQLFATDLDEVAVAQARAGVYDEEIGAVLGEERLGTFFTRQTAGWQVAKHLREMIVFAHHNLIKDPPFSRLDLLVCRNFLIYLNPEMQKRIISLFHQVLKPQGLLFLGAAESVGANFELFFPVDKKWKIFQRREGVLHSGVPPQLSTSVRLPGKVPPVRQPDTTELSPTALAEKALLESYAPPSVVVDDRYEVVHLFSGASRFLALPEGEPTRDILKMAREELRPALRAALFKCCSDRSEVAFRGIRVGDGSRESTVNLVVRPLATPQSADKLLLVVFEPGAPLAELVPHSPEQEETGSEPPKELLIRQMEEQLRITHEQLQATTEQLESSNLGCQSANEELRSINEQFQSANEELQSINEELETSKEELQALNEELVTVNAELQAKVEELNLANSNMENLLASSEIATIFLDRELNIRGFTPAAAGIFNLIASDIGRTFRHFAGKIDWSTLTRDSETVLSGQPFAEREVSTLDSEHCYLERILPFRTREGEIDGIVVTLIDITERRRAKAELAASKRKLEVALASMRDAVFISDARGHFIEFNDAFATFHKFRNKEECAKTFAEYPEILEVFLPSGEPAPVEQWAVPRALRGETGSNEEYTLRRKDTGETWVGSYSFAPIRNQEGEIVGSVVAGRDITERKHLEEQLRQSQKMEAVGQLAGGIAHDFNNILTVITGLCSLLQLEQRLEADQNEKIDQVLSAAEKAAQLTRGLLAFSRKQVIAPDHADLNEIVHHIQKFLVRTIGEDIQFSTVFNASTLPVTVDTGQIEQVLVNLVTNARDARPNGGRLLLQTSRQEFDSAFMHSHGFGKPGRYAVVTLSDTGCGMDESTRARIFEPFFTTKGVGRGTGLGMAIVYGIVRQHNGFIEFSSEPGQGSTFRIYLPITEFDREANEEPRERSMPRGGSETILVAEDEAGVRKMVEAVLTKFGYRVILAEDGRECVDKFLENRNRIDLILMDLIMPEKNGLEAYREISRIEPGVKVIYTSGYTADFIHQRGVAEEEIELVMKPVQPLDLVQKIRDVLDKGRHKN